MNIFRNTLPALVLLALVAAGTTPESMAQGGSGAMEKIIADIQAQRYQDAIAKLDVELQLAPNWAYGHYLQGLCLQYSGQADQALQKFSDARELDPDLAVAFYAAAQVRLGKGQYAQARSLLDKGLAKAGPDEKPALLQLKGQACDLLKDYECAVAALRDTAGSDCNSLYYLGHAHYGLGDWKASARALEKAVSACPAETRVRAQDLRSKALLNTGKGGYCEAMKAAKQALDAGQGSWKTYGEAALGCKKFGEAERAFRKVLASSPTDCNAIMNLGQALLGAKKYGEAEEKLGRAAGCLRGQAARNALVQKGFAQLGTARDKAKRYGGDVDECDTDVRGRRAVIETYREVKGTFEKAGDGGQVRVVENTINSLQGQIETIQTNIRIREENEEARQEQLKFWAYQIDQGTAQDSDRDGVPDEQDTCDGRPAPGDPVDLKGCPYTPPCP